MADILTKQELRALFLEKRKKLCPDLKKVLDKQICDRIRSLTEYKRAGRILLYSPFRGEIDMTILASYVNEDGKSTLFPRCFGNEMRFAEVSVTSLQQGRFGIMEPSPDCNYVSDFTSDDVCILPCLAVDCYGHRLGYGGGFYDRFLANFPGLKVAAVYSGFTVEKIFSEDFDIPADIVVTEEGALRI